MAENDHLESIFLAAADIESNSERAAYLGEACGGDAERRAKVEKLLAAHEQASGFMRDNDELPESTVDRGPLTERPGTTIGRYRLMEQIGEGGMGTVFVAEQERPVRRKVALKIIKPGMDTKDVIARFTAERQALAMMDHANIAKVLDAGSTQTGRPYFVMELVKGIPITQYCDQNKLSIVDRLRLFTKVCHAIQHAHQKGIIHRDIKPSNVLVTLHDGEPVPKVIDFGVAKAINQRLTERTIYTQFSQVVGTPLYMSPEQAELSGLDIDTRTDVYALGVLLYELLIGTTPFDKQRLRDAAFDQLRKIIREEEPPKPSTRLSSLGETATTVSSHRRTNPQKLRSLVQGDLDWIVMKALEKDRTRRYETANGLAADVERFLNDEPIVARPPSAAYRMKKLIRRHRFAVVVSALFAVVVVAGIAGTIWGLARENRLLRAVERQNILLALARGLSLCEQGQVGGGMLWLVRTLELIEKTPNRPIGLKRAVRENLETWQQQLHQLQAILRHDGSVLDVAISPDGSKILTGGISFHQIWNASTGKPIGSRVTYNDNTEVSSVVFRNDGAVFATATTGGTIQLWDTKSGMRKGEPIETPSGVWDIAFSPNGQNLVSASDDNAAYVWDLNSGKLAYEPLLHDRYVNTVAFSPNGETILTGSADKTVRLWDAATGNAEGEPLYHDATPQSVGFSHDGTSILTASFNGTVRVWDAETQCPGGLSLNHPGVMHASFSRDGAYIVTAGNDATARVWNRHTGELVGAPARHESLVFAAHFTSDGNKLVTASLDRTARIWRLAKESQIISRGQADVWWSATVSPNGAYVLECGEDNRTAHLFDISTSQRLGTPMKHEGEITGAAFSNDGSRLATVGEDGAANIWNPFTGEKLWAFSHPRSKTDQKQENVVQLLAVNFHPTTDELLVTAGWEDREAILWNTRTREIVREFAEHSERINRVVFDTSGNLLATASDDGTAKVWNVETGECIATIKHSSPVRSVGFMAEDRSLVTASDDKTVRVSRIDSEKTEKTLRLDAPVWALSIDHNRGRILTGSTDGLVQVWDSETLTQIGPSLRHPAGLVAAEFDRSGTRIVTADHETLRAWCFNTSEMTDDPQRLKTRIETISGLRLNEENQIEVLNAETWQSK